MAQNQKSGSASGRDKQGQFTKGSQAAREAGRKGGKASH